MLAHAGAETRSSSLSSFLVYLLNIRMYVLEVLKGQQIKLNPAVSNSEYRGSLPYANFGLIISLLHLEKKVLSLIRARK